MEPLMFSLEESLAGERCSDTTVTASNPFQFPPTHTQKKRSMLSGNHTRRAILTYMDLLIVPLPPCKLLPLFSNGRTM